MVIQSDEAGMTVVELLVAITIVSLVAGTLTAMLNIAQHMYGAARETCDFIHEVATTRRLITDSITQLVEPKNGISLEGGHGRLQVSAHPPRVLASSAPVLTVFDTESGNRGLFVSWQDGRDQDFRRRTVDSNRRVGITYFAPRTGWAEQWRDPYSLPAAISIMIQGKRLADDIRMVVPVRKLLSTP